jgi:conjugal transfer pilus assembly protein TraK
MRWVFIIMLAAFPAAGLSQTAEVVPDAVSGPSVTVDPSAIQQEIVVLPETAQAVEMNNADFNRIQCPGPVQDVVFSREKGLKVKYSGNNAFIKFQYLLKDGKQLYAKNPVELNVLCEGEVYRIIAVPRSLSASPKIRLSSGKKEKIRQNASLFNGMAHEKKVLRFIKLAYRDDIPNSFDTAHHNRRFDIFKGLKLVLRRTVTAEGEGLRLKEYEAVNETGGEPMRLAEKDFLKPELTSNTVAVSLSKLNLKPGDRARLFIVERRGGERE